MKFLISFFAGILFLWIAGCDHVDQGSAKLDADSLPTPDVTSRSIPQADSTAQIPAASRRMAVQFSLADALPATHRLLSDNGKPEALLEMYAQSAMNEEAIKSESQLIDLLQSRNEALLELNQAFDQISAENLDQQLPEIQSELETIGIELNMTNGTFSGLKSAEAFEEIISIYSSDPFIYYQAFIQAQEKVQASEFPFADMEPYKEMVVAGEKLMTDFPSSNHYQAIQADFQEALSHFVGIFLLKEGGYATERVNSPLEYSDSYTTETETHKQFVEQHASSRYAPIISRMLESKSSISKKPENIYAIHRETAGSMQEAREKQFDLLNKGEDVLHILPYDAGTQQEAFLLTYRFFDDEEASLQFLDALQKRSEGEMGYMNLSINRNKMYQLGI